MEVYLAIDLGAGSGRLVAGVHHGSSLELDEIYRFSNRGVEVNGACHWKTLDLFDSILCGLEKAVERYGDAIRSVAVDSWGCDHVMLDDAGQVLGGHRQYRDPRSEGMQQVLDQRMAPAEIYRRTGLQPAFYNSSLHLLAESEAGNRCLEMADRLLFTPDLLAYWLCGVAANERSIASTSQLYDPESRDWAWDVIDLIRLPRRMFGPLVDPGTVLGPLTASVRARTGAAASVQVVASAGHDTACAVAGLPMRSSGLWLSSGTWSIIGVETDSPVTCEDAFEAGLSNECGVAGSTRLLQNVAGMWMAQESMRHWAENGAGAGFDVLDRLTEEADPFLAFIDPNDPLFSSAGNMPERIQRYCRESGQRVPGSQGEILRVINESLAMKYRQVVESLQRVTGRRYDCLYAGGGGTKNRLLMQSAADALGVPVLAGPVEATSCGNLVMQMVATGALSDVAAGRVLIAASMESCRFEPRTQCEWDEAYLRFLSIPSRSQATN